jgi:hypothetical protein
MARKVKEMKKQNILPVFSKKKTNSPLVSKSSAGIATMLWAGWL